MNITRLNQQRAKKIDSKEAGLVLAQQLLDIEDLHYGLWEDDLELKLGNIREAQQRYSNLVLSCLPPPDSSPDVGLRVLDIGCGTGSNLVRMLDKGYKVDAVSPADGLTKMVKERLAKHNYSNNTTLFECRFEDFPASKCKNQYDVALFSESFQYIPVQASFSMLQRLVKQGGLIVICDFFRTEADGDSGPGDNSFGGGHSAAEFYQALEKAPFTIRRDDDITHLVSANLTLVNDLLMNKIAPAAGTLGRFFKDNYPFVSWVVARLLRKKYKRLKFKYFSGHRSKETFERYKTYHLIVLKYESVKV